MKGSALIILPLRGLNIMDLKHKTHIRYVKAKRFVSGQIRWSWSSSLIKTHTKRSPFSSVLSVKVIVPLLTAQTKSLVVFVRLNFHCGRHVSQVSMLKARPPCPHVNVRGWIERFPSNPCFSSLSLHLYFHFLTWDGRKESARSISSRINLLE